MKYVRYYLSSITWLLFQMALFTVSLQLLVTNTVPQKIHEQKCTKIKTIDISLMFAEAIRRIYHGESMSYLFRNIPMED